MDDAIGMKDGEFLVVWRRGKSCTVGDILRALASRGLRLPSHVVMTCYEAAQYQGKRVSEARRRAGDRARRQIKEWQDNPQSLTVADRAALADYPGKYKPPFRKPSGTTFKGELKRFAVAHARAVQALLEAQGKRAADLTSAGIATKNLQNDDNHKGDYINFYKDFKNLKGAIEKELRQNRL
jgi:hypothetical protein